MLDIFEKDTLYIFDKNKYKVYNGTIPNWVKICHGLIVEVENEYIGNIKVEGEEYVIFPYSCNKIKIDVTSTKGKEDGFSNSEELTFKENEEYYFDINLVDEKDKKTWMYICKSELVDVINENEGLVIDSFWEMSHKVLRKWCKIKK